MSCNPFVTDDFVFPRRPHNRPGLPRIGYRIGAYPDFVEAMLRRIDRSVELEAWTHRAPDDPGIALIEGAAILGDILTFYQERYANEAFLRTAAWRESVAALVRLLGYRLAPGIGGRATFAFEVKGDRAVEVPAGFPIKVELEALPDPADFQTEDPLTAWPHLSRFHLYRHRHYGAQLPAGATSFELASVEGVDTLAALEALELKAGDRLLLAPPAPGWLVSGSSFSASQAAPQVVEVKAVRRRLGRTVVELEAPLARSWPVPAAAYRLGRSFRHFGHAAPPTYTEPTKDAAGKIDGARERTMSFHRHLDEHECTQVTAAPGIPGDVVPLERQVDDLVPGVRLIVQTRVRNGGSGTVRPLTVVRTVADARAATQQMGALNGPTTLLTLDAPLSSNGTLWDLQADVRDYHVHEVTSPALGLRPLSSPSFSGFADGAEILSFHGTLAQVRALTGRRLLLVPEVHDPVELVSVDHADDFELPSGAPDEPRMWPLSFDRAPAPLTRADFDEDAPTVVVLGNLADATQGKEEREVVLGNGDARARFQTFRIPKTPLTYLMSEGATPPHAPELEVWVEGRMWTRVASLFGKGAKDEVFIVREDAEGTSWVQFGDGATGARLPSGVGNVSARFRSGAGAHGPAKPGVAPSPGRRLDGLDKVLLPLEATGGAPPEPAHRARAAAPGRVQSLGRMVSLADFESEALTVPGVVTAAAAWALVDGVPALTLRVLLESGREGEFEAVRATLQAWQRCRGPDRFPVRVEQAFLRWAWLDVQHAHDGRLRRDDVEAAIARALGMAGDEDAVRSGVFGLRRRRLGAREYATRIEAAVQAVKGVLWCRVTAAGLFATGAQDPAALALPAAPRPRAATLAPSTHELLQLHPGHLTLTAVQAPAQECAE